MEEIMSAVKKFLIAEGLLTGESSLGAARPTRRPLGDNVSPTLLIDMHLLIFFVLPIDWKFSQCG